MNYKLLVLAMLVGCNSVFAQIDPHNSEWMNYLEDLANAENADENALSDLFDDLSYLSENPYNIQAITKENLDKLPFLNDLQIENLLYYLYKYGPLTDIHELKNVEEWDLQTITYFLPFVYLGDAPESEKTVSKNRNSLKYSKQNVILRSNRTIQKKAGYTRNEYWGDPYYLSLRYEFSLSDKIQFGFNGEKDAGESLWNGYNKVFDYLTYNLQLKNLGYLDNLHIGNYRLTFGQGLVMNTNFSMGKTADVTNIAQKNKGIQRHLSSNESKYLNGIAGTVHYKSLQTSLFYSYRNLDASSNATEISSFVTDGFHRTYTEMRKRKIAGMETFGGNVEWGSSNLSVGFTGVYYNFNGKNLNPDRKPYNTFYLRGTEHWNAGFHFKFRWKHSHLQGETAMDKTGKIASLTHFSFKPAAFLDWTLSYRYYDRAYNAFYANGFAESSSVQNESGFYTGMKMQLPHTLELSAYWDSFQFPWLKYEVNTPSEGNDVLMQLKGRPRSNQQLSLRYKYKEKQQNVSPYEQHRWRVQWKCDFSKQFSVQSQADYSFYSGKNKESRGWSFGQSVAYQPFSNLQLNGNIGYFHTDDWDSRITVYEKNVLYAFGFPTYYGQGLRYAFLVKWQIMSRLIIYFKCGSSHYFDRDAIGSGWEAIEGNEKTDIFGVIKYRF
ncbi:MAG: helix-hairpin-helix domain-containing protein [Dysgonamonadaceae bacterium]|jgi:hypothetical protein|nr:helix-hairpin-helix domain-containing protein [Dysgonamonadaceae bacterium]